MRVLVERHAEIADRTVIHAEKLEVRLHQPDGVQVVFGTCELHVGRKHTDDDEHDRAEEFDSDPDRDHEPVG